MLKSKVSKCFALMLVLVFIGFGLLAGCDVDDLSETDPEVNGDGEVKGDVEILYVEWECALASTFVAAAVLEDMGYNVNTTSVSGALMWSGLAAGEGDFFTTAWLPATHAEYFTETEGQIVELARNYRDPAGLGLVVPAYVEIDSIEEINDHLDKFDDRIIGIDPGAGLMGLTEELIVEYGLNVELVEGTDATMTAALKSAIDRGEWVVVTGWFPHWKFAEWDLKILDDPKGILGEEEYIATFARLGLDTDMPEVYSFLQNFEWGAEDIGVVMAMNTEEGADPAQSARIWVDNNQSLVQTWIP